MHGPYHRDVRLLVAVLAASVLAAGCGVPARPAAGARVLVFSRTAGFRHDSIPAGIAALRDLGATGGYAVDATEDAHAFTGANLARYRAVVFLNTTGDVLDPGQQESFESYVRGGGGYVGVHAAADTEYGWPFYGELVGTWFASHPAVQPARIVVEDRRHPATAHLGPSWSRTDEWYNFRADPRPRVHVLLALDESTYSGGSMRTDHPIAWCHPVGAGRAFYTGGGHTVESYAEPAFRAHLLGAVRYAAGLAPGDCTVSGTASPGTDESPAAAATGLSLPGPGEAPDFHFYSGNG
jgi:type 1 glutamine amidotransferase